MERWVGILKVSLDPNRGTHFNVAASLSIAPSSRTLTVPSRNVVFFNGDRARGTGDPVIEKLSDITTIASILVSKLGSSVNAWVVEASTFNGPFAVYKEFLSSVNSRGEPRSYNPDGFPAAVSCALLLSRCFTQAKNVISAGKKEPAPASSHFPASSAHAQSPETIVLGFSKGGTVLNQLLAELAHSKHELLTTGNLTHISESLGGDRTEVREESPIIPTSKDGFLNSISEFHYVDVGLNCNGAYLTDHSVIKKIGKRDTGIRFIFHGTPRQWRDANRPWICDEKDRLVRLLDQEAHANRGKVQVLERFYFAERPPSLRMHFEIIEHLDLS